MNQCVAPKEGGGRCEGTRLGDSLHCPAHNAVLKPLYLKYKAIKIADVLGLSHNEMMECDVQQLLKYSHRVENVYELRVEYRRRGFVPAMWDRGHDNMIELCIRCLMDIRTALGEKFMRESETGGETDDLDDNSVDIDDEKTQESNPAPAVEKMNAKITQIIEEESSWGDSEAIRQYNLKIARIEAGMNVVKSLVQRLYIEDARTSSFLSEKDDVITALTARLINYLFWIYNVVHRYNRRGLLKSNGAVIKQKISWDIDLIYVSTNNFDIMLTDVIHMAVKNSNFLRDLISACKDRKGFVPKASLIRGVISRNPDHIKISIVGCGATSLIVEKVGEDLVWHFEE